MQQMIHCQARKEDIPELSTMSELQPHYLEKMGKGCHGSGEPVKGQSRASMNNC